MKRTSNGKLQGNTSRPSTSRSQAEQVVDNKIKDEENYIHAMARTLKENVKQIAIAAAEKKPDSQIHTYINRAGKRTTFCNAPPKTNNNTTKVDDILLKDSIYIDSIKGKFGWELFEGYHVPYIKRLVGGEHLKFVSVRMAEIQLLKNGLNYLHADMYTCTSVKSYFISDHEAQLLNDINKNAEYAYRKIPFVAGKDLVVTLEDAQEFYTFMEVCFKKLQCKITPGHNDKCGFIRINSESVVPYCTKDGKKFVPMFYFEGKTERLRSQAVKLENWNLAYLKFCCKVQGIKTEFFNRESCVANDLDIVKTYFSPESSFQEYWPSKLIDTHLLTNQQSNHVRPSGVWIRAPLEVPHDEHTIPSPLIEPAPQSIPPRVFTQSIPQIQNTHQNEWPANKLVHSYTIQIQTQTQPSTDLKHCAGTSNQNIAPQCYNTGSTMSQGSSSGGARHDVQPTRFVYPAEHTTTGPAFGNTVPYSNVGPRSQPRSQHRTTICNPMSVSYIYAPTNHEQESYTPQTNNCPPQRRQFQSQQVQQHQQQQIKNIRQTQQAYRDQSGHGPKDPQRRKELKNLKPLPDSVTIDLLDSPPSSPVLPTVHENSIHPGIPEQKWAPNYTSSTPAYKGSTMSQGSSSGGARHDVQPTRFVYPAEHTTTGPAFGNTVPYSNVGPRSQPRSQHRTTICNPMSVSYIYAPTNHEQESYTPQTNNCPPQRRQFQSQQVQQHQQQQIKNIRQTQQAYRDQSGHGPKDPQRRKELKNLKPLPDSVTIDLLDSPPSSPVLPTVHENSIHPGIPEQKWAPNYTSSTPAYKGSTMSQGSSSGGARHDVQPTRFVYPAEHTTTGPAFGNTVPYSNVGPRSQPRSQHRTTICNPMSVSYIYAPTNHEQESYTPQTNNCPPQRRQFQSQQVQQHQQQQIKNIRQTQQAYRDQSGHGPKDPQRRKELKNLKPLPDSVTIDLLDSPPSSPVLPTVHENSIHPGIPEQKWAPNYTSSTPAYKMYEAKLQYKIICCVNAKPFVYSDLMVTINDLVWRVLSPPYTVPICVHVLTKYLHVTLYSGNSEQLAVLRGNERVGSIYTEQTPMAFLQDINRVMPELYYYFNNKSDEEIQQLLCTFFGEPSNRQQLSYEWAGNGSNQSVGWPKPVTGSSSGGASSTHATATGWHSATEVNSSSSSSGGATSTHATATGWHSTTEVNNYDWLNAGTGPPQSPHPHHPSHPRM